MAHTANAALQCAEAYGQASLCVPEMWTNSGRCKLFCPGTKSSKYRSALFWKLYLWVKMTENRFCFLELCYISASVIFRLNPASVELSAVWDHRSLHPLEQSPASEIPEVAPSQTLKIWSGGMYNLPKSQSWDHSGNIHMQSASFLLKPQGLFAGELSAAQPECPGFGNDVLHWFAAPAWWTEVSQGLRVRQCCLLASGTISVSGRWQAGLCREKSCPQDVAACVVLFQAGVRSGACKEMLPYLYPRLLNWT